MSTSAREYEVAISFAGEQRDYARKLADLLFAMGIKVFFDEFERSKLWGQDLAETFHRIYSSGSGRAVLLISKDYIDKKWCKHERRSAISEYLKHDGHILPVRFDESWPEGLPDTIGYEDATKTTPGELSAIIGDILGIKPFEGKAHNVPAPHSTAQLGVVEFDYGAYNGRYVIGEKPAVFETKWSRAGDQSIHAYNDPAGINGIALARGAKSLADIKDASSYDFTSRTRTVAAGGFLIIRNTDGFYAAVKIEEVRVAGSDAPDYCRFFYVILNDKSADFSHLAFLE